MMVSCSGRKLPPMRTECHSVCAVGYRDHLLVAGGETVDGISNTVETFDGSHWLFVQPLPMRYYDLKCAILDCHWYLMGGNKGLLEPTLDQDKAVHYACLDSLLASCQLGETSLQQSSIWKSLPDAPNQLSSTAVFGSRLIAVGGEGDISPLSDIHAYSFQTNSWIHIGNMPFAISRTFSMVLPTGELMVVGGVSNSENSVRNVDVLKATITGNFL